MKNKKWLRPAIITLVCLVFVGVLIYLLGPRLTATPVDMKLHASVISGGKVQETFELSAKGQIRTGWDKQVVFDGDFDNSGSSFRYNLGGNSDPITFMHSQYPLHKEYPDHGAFTASTFVYDRDTNAMSTFWVAMDVEAECIIFRWKEALAAPYQYIVASVDESKTPQELLDYFDWFV